MTPNPVQTFIFFHLPPALGESQKSLVFPRILPMKTGLWLGAAAALRVSDSVRDGVRLAVPQTTEWQHVGNQTRPLLRFGFTNCTRTKGKSEVKRTAFSQPRLDPYSSRMFFDHHFCNVESESYTAAIFVMYL
jgi:hypothetical protein